jgi:hypothetical protein
VAYAAENNGPIAGETRGPITVDGGWDTFSWNTAVSPWATEQPFTFTISGAGVLQVTDAFLDGDQFRIYDNGTPIGLTSVPTDTGAFQSDPDLAYADPSWSSGEFAMADGDHSITIEVVAGYPSGGAYLQGFSVQAAVPTLSWPSIAVFTALLAVLGVMVVRRMR